MEISPWLKWFIFIDPYQIGATFVSSKIVEAI